MSAWRPTSHNMPQRQALPGRTLRADERHITDCLPAGATGTADSFEKKFSPRVGAGQRHSSSDHRTATQQDIQPMRRIVVSTFTSLDGVMQAPGGPQEDPVGGFALGGWTAPHFDAALGASMGEIFGRPFDLLLGRKTYDIFAAHWPFVPDPSDPMAATFNKVTKYVASRSNPKLAWQNSQLLGTDVIASLKQL